MEPQTDVIVAQAIAQDARHSVPYWRVIKKSGELFPYFPGGVEGHANCLRQEGFTIDTTGKVPRIHHHQELLVRSTSSEPVANLPNH